MSCGSNNLLGLRWGIRPIVLEGAPHENVAEAEGVPPVVEHLPIQAQGALAGYACGWWSDRSEAIIDAGAIRIADAGEQMPKRERVFLAGVDEEDPKQSVALCRRIHVKVKSRQGFAEGSGSIFKIRCARADLWARGTHGASGDERFVAVELEADPAESRAQEARARIVYLQGVNASQIHGHGGRRIDNKLARRRPDGGVNRSALEREPLAASSALDDPDSRACVDVNGAGFIEGDVCPGRTVGHECLPNAKLASPCIRANGFQSDSRRACQTSHFPGWAPIIHC